MATKPIQAANENSLRPAFYDANGNSWPRPDITQDANPNPRHGGSGGGGNDDVKPLWRLDVPRDVQIAKWGLSVLMLAFASAFLWFIGEFKDVRKDISDVKSSVAAQTATTTDIQSTLGRIEDKLDKPNDDTQAGSRSERDREVHRRTGS